MLCSIIITNYNKQDYVAAAIDSALSQTFGTREDGCRAEENLEVIVVDDGSTDDFLEAIAPYQNRIILIRKRNGGQASAMNSGTGGKSG